MGKQLRKMLHEAGFTRVRGMSRSDSKGTKEEIELAGSQGFIDVFSNAMETAAKLGWTDAGAKDRVADQFYAFAAKPEAFYSVLVCQAIGWKE